MKPQRKCIGCGESKDKDLLIRIVLVDNQPVIDSKKILPGRGCYLCDNTKCFDKAIKKRALNRAFRHDISSDALGRCLNDRQ